VPQSIRFLADGEVAGQEVSHLHLHVIPRFAGDPLGPGRPFRTGPAASEVVGGAPSRAELDVAAVGIRRAYASIWGDGR
jgi:diadenosine tetraphosphate (Ap4A) HIT family hydrolase